MKHQPLDLSIKLGEYSYQIIQQNFQRIIEQEKAIFEDKDPEPLHQMRVGMRRLRTAIQVFGSAIVLPKAVSNPSIGKTAKSLGETRDLDVLQQELISRYQPLLDNTELLKFEKVLKRLQKKTRSQLSRFTEDSEWQKLLRLKAGYSILARSAQTYNDRRFGSSRSFARLATSINLSTFSPQRLAGRNNYSVRKSHRDFY